MKLFYRELGEKHAKSLIILHGVFGSSDNWLTLGKRFAENYHVYLVDQRNHGQSPHDDEFTYEAMKEDLKGFIDQHQIENPHIIGHSMGGKVVMKFALDYPEVYDRLIVVDIAARSYPVHHGKLLEGLQAIDLDGLKSRSAADKALAAYEPILGVRQFLLKNLYRNENNEFDWRINLSIIARDIEKISIAIEGNKSPRPVLFMRGLNSHYISDQDKVDLLNLFPQASFEDFEGAGHWVHAEKPQAFYESVMKWLNG